MIHRAALSRFHHFAKSALLVAGMLTALSITVSAQDAVRPSLAGQDAYNARQEDVSRIPYNLLLGPVRFRVGATVGVEYNDNINYADVNTEDDVIVTPSLTLDMLWPVTQLNTLRLDLGLAYSFYLDHSDNNTDYLLVAPKSQIAFDIFVGDFRINLHDRMQLQQDPVQEGALSNVTNYGRFENTAGVSLLWDLNKILLQIGYDHYNFVATNSDFDYLNRNAEIIGGSAAFIVNPTITVGAEGNAVFTRFDEQANFNGSLNDNENYSVGGFAEIALTSNLKARVAGGYQWMDFDNNFVLFPVPTPLGFFVLPTPDHKHLEDYYVNGLISHRINAQISQTLSAGHENQLGIQSNYITLNYVRHTVSWNILRNTLVTTEFFYEDAQESGGPLNSTLFTVLSGQREGEHFHRLGGAVTLGYQLTPHVTLGVRYQGTTKDSNVFLRDYNQNRVSVDGTYSF
ncbi:MAG TPA: outer membrane beta-barrel protein [Chthoniobacterales bacterium]|nr:outer membrane beta-barrel protein [Chthoniobacterales bacterium]